MIVIGIIILIILVGLLMYAMYKHYEIKDGAKRYFSAIDLNRTPTTVRLFEDKITIKELNLIVPFSRIRAMKSEQRSYSHGHGRQFTIDRGYIFDLAYVDQRGQLRDLLLSSESYLDFGNMNELVNTFYIMKKEREKKK